jgi:tetratricopeptide (TPR) repeat protein
VRQRSGRREDQPLAENGESLPNRQISAHRDISGIASTGDHAVNIQNQAGQIMVLPSEAFAPMTDLAAPAGLTNLPIRPELFVGRVRELGCLDAALAEPSRVVVQAIHGLGGIGKSALAAHWAATRSAVHTVTWWIAADGPASIDAGLASLARTLQPALAGILPAEGFRARAVQWLAAHHGWLIVLDNVINPADVAPLLAQASTGRFLITSRRATGWHNFADPIRLDVLAPAEALDLLTQIAGAGSDNLNGAVDLCEELGFLPLAIEQVGAYLAETGITPRDYLELLERYPADMYQASPEGGDASRTIARIWHVTLDRLADEPLIGQLLRILAWYAPTNIPRALLDGLGSPVAVTRAVGRLSAYNMITVTAEVFGVHRLVQAVARTPEPNNPHREALTIETARDQAARQLAVTLPDWEDPAQWPAWRLLLPHVNALAGYVRSADDTLATFQVLVLAGAFLNTQGQVALAANYFQRALGDAERLLEATHPAILTCRSNLAYAYQASGDLSRALVLFRQVIADQERAFGADHPHTLNSRNNLAGVYYSMGDLERAAPLLEQVLADLDRVLGADHPATLTARNNVASAYQATGDLSRAVPLFEQVLADRQRVLGPDHPDTLTSRNNLASAYQATGDLSQAARFQKRLIADQERVLGPDHVATLNSRGNLASIYRSAGNLRRAVLLFEQAHADHERVLGPDHPSTLTSRANLASIYYDIGDLNRAVPTFEQVLADHERVLGYDHPHTLSCRNGLATAYYAVGDLNRAVPLFEQVADDRRRTLGADHPESLSSLRSLAQALHASTKQAGT